MPRRYLHRGLIRRRCSEFRNSPRCRTDPGSRRSAQGVATGWTSGVHVLGGTRRKHCVEASVRGDLGAWRPQSCRHTTPGGTPGGTLRSPEDLLRVLNAAGFTETETRRVHGEWRVAIPGDLVEGFRRGTVLTAALIAAQPAKALPAIEAAITRGAAAYRDSDGFAVPITAILGSGIRG